MSFNPPQPEVWSFPQSDWENIPDIIRSYFLKSNLQTNKLLDWLSKHQFPEKIKTGFKNQEKNQQQFEEFKANQQRDFQIYKDKVHFQHQQFEQKFEFASQERQIIEQKTSLGTFVNVKEIQKDSESFRINQQRFNDFQKIRNDFLDDEKQKDRIKDQQVENQYLIWTMINVFEQDSFLKRKFDAMSQHIKSIENKIIQNQEQLLVLTHANSSKLQSFEQNTTQTLVEHRLDIDKLMGLDFQGLQLNMQKSMEELSNLKNASLVMQKLDDKYLKKFTEIQASIKELNIKIQESSIENENKIKNSTDYLKNKQDEENQKIVKREQNLSDRISGVNQEMLQLNSKIDDQASSILQQVEQKAMDNNTDLSVKYKELNNMIKNLRKDSFSEIQKLENSQLDIFPRIVNCQKGIDDLKENIEQLTGLKDIDFLEKLQMKFKGFTQFTLNRCDIIEVAIKQLVNCLQKFTKDKKKYLSKQISTLRDQQVTNQDNKKYEDEMDKSHPTLTYGRQSVDRINTQSPTQEKQQSGLNTLSVIKRDIKIPCTTTNQFFNPLKINFNSSNKFKNDKNGKITFLDMSQNNPFDPPQQINQQNYTTNKQILKRGRNTRAITASNANQRALNNVQTENKSPGNEEIRKKLSKKKIPQIHYNSLMNEIREAAHNNNINTLNNQNTQNSLSNNLIKDMGSGQRSQTEFVDQKENLGKKQENNFTQFNKYGSNNLTIEYQQQNFINENMQIDRLQNNLDQVKMLLYHQSDQSVTNLKQQNEFDDKEISQKQFLNYN